MVLVNAVIKRSGDKERQDGKFEEGVGSNGECLCCGRPRHLRRIRIGFLCY